MNTNFTAIDFETAQGKRWSICQIGLVRVENGQIVHQSATLIKPPENLYFGVNSQIHGISARHTQTAPLFRQVWPELRTFIEGQTVVAHNGAFDFSCLSQVLDYYRLPKPAYQQQCTYRIFGKGLAECCREHAIELKHHHALSDALACARLYQIHLRGRNGGS
jgi:DNA polymerase-3 subunit epsilon